MGRRRPVRPHVPRPAHRAPETRHRGAAQGAHGPAPVATPRPPPPALGAVVRRGRCRRPRRPHPEDAPLLGRRRVRRRRRHRAARPRTVPAASAARAQVDPRAGAPADRADGRERDRAGHRAGRAGAVGPRRAARTQGHDRAGQRDRPHPRDGRGHRAQDAVERADQPAPPVGGRPAAPPAGQGHQGRGQGVGRREGLLAQRRRAGRVHRFAAGVPPSPGRTGRRPRPQGDGAGVGAGRVRAGRPRQPRVDADRRAPDRRGRRTRTSAVRAREHDAR